MLNDKEVIVVMKRIDLCNLMLACTTVACLTNQIGNEDSKWLKLRDMLAKELEDFDKNIDHNS